MAPPFEQGDSDEDSISVTSTRISDVDGDYPVEKINYESEEDGQPLYLVKWEGYPLHTSTWEPAENILGADILPNWEREKEEIRAGTREPFDREAYDQLVVDEAIARNERHKRRVAKRRRKGLPSRSGSISNGSANDAAVRHDTGSSSEDEPLLNRRTGQKTVIPKRKGLAVEVKKSLNRQAVEALSSSEESSDADDDKTSEDSLLIRSRNKQRANADPRPSASSSRISKTAAQPTARGMLSKNTTPAASPTKRRKAAPPDHQSAAAPRITSTTSTRDRALERANHSSSARKTAPSTAAFVSANATATNRLPVLPDDPRPRLSGKTSITLTSKPGPRRTRKMSESDPRHQRYANLSEQNRYRKHAAKEAAPDPSVLSTFNPKTGRYEAPAATASRALSLTSRIGGSSASAIPSAFGRRDEPARGRRRSASRSPPRAPPISTSSSNNVAQHKKVCWDWRNSRCTKQYCTFAHYYITCPYWKDGGCRLKEIDCQYDHQPGRDPMVENPQSFPPADQPNRAPFSDQQQPPVIQGFDVAPQQTHALPGKSALAVEQTITPASIPTHPRMVKPEKRTLLHLSDITCRFWAAGGCFSTNCRLAHRDTGHYIDFKDVTCSFWLDGRRCKREEKDCKFAHRLTEYRAGPPGSEQIVFEPTNDTSGVPGSLSRGEVAADSASSVLTTNPHSHAGLDDGVVTCHYWLTEAGCSKPDGQCRYAHRHSHHRAAPPKSRQWDRILYEPEGTQALHKNRAGAIDASGTQRSLLHKTAAAYTFGSEPMAVDEPLISGSNATPISRRQPSAPQSSADGPASIDDVTLMIAVNERRFEIAVSLACSTEQDRAILLQGLGSEHRLELNRILDTNVLRRYWGSVTRRAVEFPSGDIVPTQSSGSERLEERATERLAAFYEKATSCGVVLTSTLTLLVYPATSQDLGFLNRAGDPESQATLKFKLLPGLPMAVQDKITLALTATLKMRATEHAAINDTENIPSLQHLKHFLDARMEDLLKISDVKTEDQVFVMMPESKAAEMKLIAEAYKERFKQPDYKDRNCKVWTSQKPGSWDSLLSHRITKCLLIVHPDVLLWSIPSLGKLLHQSGMRVFSINTEPTQTASDEGHKGLSCERLFPMGDVVFITDDVFIQSPGKVLAIIDEINKGNKDKQAGATRHKIATRPGIRTWLVDLIISLEGKEDGRLGMLLERIMDLSPMDQDDEQFPGNPSEAADLVSLPPEQLPTFQALQNDQPKATDLVVNWFAGWAFMNAGNFRRFTVCHEEPGTGKQAFNENYDIVMKDFEADPRGWGKEFQYMLVMTPDQWLKEAKTKTKSAPKK